MSGLLLAAAFPPSPLLPLAFVALVPFAVFLHDLPPGRDGAASGFRGGVILGGVAFGLLLHWIVPAVSRVSVLALPVYLAAVGLLALLVGAVAWAAHRIRGVGCPSWLALTLAWTAGEWVRAHAGDLSFPWLGLAVALADAPGLLGAAEWVGERGVSFWLAGTGGLGGLVVARLREGGRGWRAPAVGLGLWVLIPAAAGVLRGDALELRPALRVAVVQPDLAFGERRSAGAGAGTGLRALDEVWEEIPTDVDLVALPETVVPLEPGRSRTATALAGLSGRAGAPLLVGVVRRTEDPARRFNAAVLVDEEGTTGFAWDKRRLVPGIERVPFMGGGFSRGEGWPLADVAGEAVGALICFESAFGGVARRLRLEGADLLVNLTNDGWFGGEPRWARTLALWQHPAHLVVRAVELRIGIVRAANNGISLFVDARGRTSGRTPLFEPAVTVATVSTTELVTLYARLGDWFGGTATALVVGLLLVAATRSPSSSGPRPPHHRPDGGFRNPGPAPERGGGAFLRWQLERRREGVPPNPAPEDVPRDAPRPFPGRAGPGEARITWIGHATTLIQLPGLTLLTDPVWSRRASPVSWAGPERLAPPGMPFQDLPPVDGVLLSHDHYDHLDAPTVRRLVARYGPALRWWAPLGHARWLARRGAGAVQELDWGQEARFDGSGATWRIVCTPAWHWSRRGLTIGRRLWSSWAVLPHDGGPGVYFAGDSAWFDGFRRVGARLGPFRATLLPIGAYEPRWFMKDAHMNPEEAVRAWEELGGSGAFLGLHWGTFRLTDEDPLEPPMRTREAWERAGHPPEGLHLPGVGGTVVLD